ncbi:MAG TPA: hypothetical protein VHE81_04910 [Lacipirellulaceae bacterium]|nr:hypothetical protein [Lacipirellulaceae bacterium]
MIYSLSSCTPILATWQESTGIWGRFDGQPATYSTFELITIAFVVLLLSGSLVWQFLPSRRRRDFRCNNPMRLFAELCRAHHLDRPSRRLLKQLAAAHRLKCPGVLFVEPDYFDTTSLPPALKPSANDLRHLRHMLFD